MQLTFRKKITSETITSILHLKHQVETVATSF